jgi:hypothetical protein
LADIGGLDGVDEQFTRAMVVFWERKRQIFLIFFQDQPETQTVVFKVVPIVGAPACVK